MTFARTTSGLIASTNFRKGQITVFVEGPTDWTFYDEIYKRDTDLNRFDCVIKPAGGKPQCRLLADALKVKKGRYIVIFDGDYDILPFPLSIDPQVVLLHRHSVENYLLEAGPIEQFCLSHVHPLEHPELASLTCEFGCFLEKIKDKFKNLLVLDIARDKRAPDIQSFFKNENGNQNSDRFFKSTPGIDFDDIEINRWSSAAAKRISSRGVATAATLTLVNNFLNSHRLIDLLPGHFAFSIIKRFIIQMLIHGKLKRYNSVTSNASIQSFLSVSVWQLVAARGDHKNLKDSLCKALKACP